MSGTAHLQIQATKLYGKG